MTPRPVLYHFTCDHGAEGIRASGLVRPMTPWFQTLAGIVTGMGSAPPVAWLTSDAEPTRDSIGLTSETLTCDRMAWRVTVGPVPAWPWRSFADLHGCTDDYWRLLVGTSWGRPDRWFVSTRSVEAVDIEAWSTVGAEVGS